MAWVIGSAMPRWRFGLRWRLALGFAVILALALGSVALFTVFAAEREVARVQVEQDRVRANRIVVSLAEFYASNGGWDGAQSFVNRISFQTEREIIVLDTEDLLVADSGLRNGGRRERNGHDRTFFDHRGDPHQPVRPQFFRAHNRRWIGDRLGDGGRPGARRYRPSVPLGFPRRPAARCGTALVPIC